ncbi:MAG: SDR family oxidoreductase [Gammaproteobacteria bacterium]|nr:SDR family oxidoreductase [Gammaproteobacteria bacterium]
MLRFITLVLFILVSLNVEATNHAASDSDQKAVLVTGASSGLGRVMTEAMAAQGYFVYAGARKDKDIEELNGIENVQAIRLDVNKPEQIDAAVKTITQAGRGLYGLVNNAGVVVLKPLIEIDPEDFHFQMNVNIYGPYRVTRAFAPLIIESKGRISIIGSIAGTLSSATWGPYSMTKHAMEAYADALKAEMSKFDVHVSLIEPGTYKSKIAESALSRMEQRNQTMEDSQFQAEMSESVNWLAAFQDTSGDPAEVAEVVIHALSDDTPKPRYMIVPNQEQAHWTINRAMERLAEQNAGHEFSFDRETLIEMLDASLAKQN